MKGNPTNTTNTVLTMKQIIVRRKLLMKRIPVRKEFVAKMVNLELAEFVNKLLGVKFRRTKTRYAFNMYSLAIFCLKKNKTKRKILDHCNAASKAIRAGRTFLPFSQL